MPHLAVATESGTFVVDDDHGQCPNAEFETIQKAVDQATKKNTDKSPNNNVELISVCPGLYAEHVSVTTSVTIRGVPDAVSAIDCFGPTLPLDPAQHAIVDGAGSSALALFKLEANNIQLEGFVVQGAASVPRSTDFRLFRHGIETSDAYSGYRIRDNMLVGNDVGVVLRSGNRSDPLGSVLPSTFDHNCLRDNGWGLSNDFLRLTNARIYDNSTLRTQNFAFEQTGYCPEAVETGLFTQCTASRIGMDGVTFDHNTSVSDDIAYRFASSSSTIASDNTVSDARIAMRLFAGTLGLQIANNSLSVRQVGLGIPALQFASGVLIQGNLITGAPGLTGIGLSASGLKDSSILNNVISGFQGTATGGCPGCGMVFSAGNTGNVARGNTVINNARDGIQVASGATGNVFETNTMLSNGLLDARDLNTTFPLNVWSGNLCGHSQPEAICGTAP